MSKIGFIYDSSKIRRIVNRPTDYSNSYNYGFDPPDSDYKFVGLTFGIPQANPDIIQIKEIYFNITTVGFKQKLVPPTDLDFETDNYWMLPLGGPPSTASGLTITAGIKSHLQFNNPVSDPFEFSFFSLKQMQIIASISGKVILSGAQHQAGAVVSPQLSGLSTFTNLQFEVDEADLTNDFTTGRSGSCVAMPFIIYGTPCPPQWNSNCPSSLYKSLIPPPGQDFVVDANEIGRLQCNWFKFASKLYKTNIVNPPDVTDLDPRISIM